MKEIVIGRIVVLCDDLIERLGYDGYPCLLYTATDSIRVLAGSGHLEWLTRLHLNHRHVRADDRIE